MQFVFPFSQRICSIPLSRRRADNFKSKGRCLLLEQGQRWSVAAVVKPSCLRQPRLGDDRVGPAAGVPRRPRKYDPRIPAVEKIALSAAPRDPPFGPAGTADDAFGLVEPVSPRQSPGAPITKIPP